MARKFVDVEFEDGTKGRVYKDEAEMLKKAGKLKSVKKEEKQEAETKEYKPKAETKAAPRKVDIGRGSVKKK